MCTNCDKKTDIGYLVTHIPAVLPEPAACENPEPCTEVILAQCVAYEDEPLPIIGVDTHDRLNIIIKQLAAMVGSTTQAIDTEDTNTVDLTGNGTSNDKLKADVKVDPVSGNLIQVGVNGLSVVLDKDAVMTVLNLVKNNADLQSLFCELVSNCGSQVCGIISGLNGAVH